MNLLDRLRAGRPQIRSFEHQIYDAIVERGDTCFDIGANIGDMAERLACLAGPSGLVVAFEPVWPMYRRLCERLQRRRRPMAAVVTVPCGLAEAAGQATIQVPGGDYGQGSLAGSHDWAALHPGAEIVSYRCRLETLDGFIDASRTAPPAFMKIDVEGAELGLLKGAQALLASASPPLLLLELYAPWQLAFGVRPWDVLGLLSGHGYRFLFVCPEGLVEHAPSAAEPFPAAYERGYNVIAWQAALHADRIGRLAGLRAGGPVRPLPMDPAPMPNRVPE